MEKRELYRKAWWTYHWVHERAPYTAVTRQCYMCNCLNRFYLLWPQGVSSSLRFPSGQFSRYIDWMKAEEEKSHLQASSMSARRKYCQINWKHLLNDEWILSADSSHKNSFALQSWKVWYFFHFSWWHRFNWISSTFEALHSFILFSPYSAPRHVIIQYRVVIMYPVHHRWHHWNMSNNTCQLNCWVDFIIFIE